MTYASIPDALDAMCSLFVDVWKDGAGEPLPCDYPNSEFNVDALAPSDLWARWRAQHSIMGQATLATVDGKRRWNRTGFITIQLFTAANKGVRGAYETAEKVVKAYQGQPLPGGAWFRDVRINEPSDNNGLWYQLNVVLDFEYEQIT